MIKRSAKTYNRLFDEAGFSTIMLRKAHEINSIKEMDPDGCRVWVLNNSPELKANADHYAVVGKNKK